MPWSLAIRRCSFQRLMTTCCKHLAPHPFHLTKETNAYLALTHFLKSKHKYWCPAAWIYIWLQCVWKRSSRRHLEEWNSIKQLHLWDDLELQIASERMPIHSCWPQRMLEGININGIWFQRCHYIMHHLWVLARMPSRQDILSIVAIWHRECQVALDVWQRCRTHSSVLHARRTYICIYVTLISLLHRLSWEVIIDNL